MPKWVDNRAKKFLADPEFYPKRKPDERKRLAYATATKLYNQRMRKKRTSKEFHGDFMFKVESFANAIDVIESRKAGTPDNFFGVIPIDPSSMLITAVVQTEAIKKMEGYMVTAECTEAGIKRLGKAPYNTFFSNHRYADEYSIGLTRKIVKNMAVVEIFRGAEDHQGRITARGIGTKRIKSVSSHFWVKEQYCGICEAVGKPYLTCGHYPGEKHGNKTNIVKVTKADYFELSSAPIGLDDGALILHHESISRLYKEPIGESLINEDVDNVDHTPIQGVPTKMDEPQKELIKQNAALEEQLKQQRQDMKDFKEQFTTYKEQGIVKDKEITLLRDSNKTLTDVVEAVKVENRKNLIKEAYDARKACGWTTEELRVKEVAFLESLSEDQLGYAIENAMANIKETPGKQGTGATPQIPPTHADSTLVPGAYDSRMGKLEIALRSYSAFLKTKYKDHKPTGGKGFQPIVMRETPIGHVDSKDIPAGGGA